MKTIEIPLSVPVVMCLAANNGCTGVRLPIAETGKHLGSAFCSTCAARSPCYTHHSAKPNQP